jgi:hypothetical protein
MVPVLVVASLLAATGETRPAAQAAQAAKVGSGIATERARARRHGQ